MLQAQQREKEIVEFNHFIEGGFSSIQLGFDISKDQPIVIKRNNDIEQQIQENSKIIDIQAQIKKLRLTNFGSLMEYRIIDEKKFGLAIIMPLLGSNLEELRLLKQEAKFSEKEISKLAIVLIEHLENLHQTGYVHGDIKPENILIGNTEINHKFSLNPYLCPLNGQQVKINADQEIQPNMNILDSNSLQKSNKNSNKNNQIKIENTQSQQQLDIKNQTSHKSIKNYQQVVELIDYGGACKYRYIEENGSEAHIPQSQESTITCTIPFSSITQMQGYSISRRDDLESLFYTLIRLSGFTLEEIVDVDVLLSVHKKVSRSLSQGHQSILKFYILKSGINEKSLRNANVPFTLILLWRHIKRLNFEDQPHYKYLTTLFQSSLDNQESLENVLDIELNIRDPLLRKYSKLYNRYMKKYINKQPSTRQQGQISPYFSQDKCLNYSNNKQLDFCVLNETHNQGNLDLKVQEFPSYQKPLIQTHYDLDNEKAEVEIKSTVSKLKNKKSQVNIDEEEDFSFKKKSKYTEFNEGLQNYQLKIASFGESSQQNLISNQNVFVEDSCNVESILEKKQNSDCLPNQGFEVQSDMQSEISLNEFSKSDNKISYPRSLPNKNKSKLLKQNRLSCIEESVQSENSDLDESCQETDKIISLSVNQSMTNYIFQSKCSILRYQKKTFDNLLSLSMSEQSQENKK
eukprot:403338984